MARLLAKRLGYIYIDSGAMYRAIGWKAKRELVNPADEQALTDLCRRTDIVLRNHNDDLKIFVDGIDVSEAIRTPEMGMMASAVSKSRAVRTCLLSVQRGYGAEGGVVMDGRDIGTVVFPDADIKFYLDATAEERSKRRYRELKAKGQDVALERITNEIRLRDEQDSGRDIAPLVKAPDAIFLDTSRLGIHEVVETLVSKIRKKV